MLNNLMIKVSKGTRAFAQRVVRKTEGVAAIEFAMIVPILMLGFIGTFELVRAVGMDRRFSTVISMTSDLVAREEDLGANPAQTLDNIMQVVTHVMQPYDTSVLQLEVIPVMADPNDATNTFVYAPPYSYGNGGTNYSKCDSYDLSAAPGVIGPGGSVIVVEGRYSYAPVFEGIFDNLNAGLVDFSSEDTQWDDSATWEDRSIHSPRHSCVDFEQNNCVVTCN